MAEAILAVWWVAWAMGDLYSYCTMAAAVGDGAESSYIYIGISYYHACSSCLAVVCYRLRGTESSCSYTRVMVEIPRGGYGELKHHPSGVAL